MIDPAADSDAWREELPDSFGLLVVTPQRFERHEDAPAHAQKIVGLDASGRPCYLRHTHTLTVERFDIDEFPLEVAVLRERRFAWRLASGRWLRLGERLDRLDSCRPRLLRQGPELVAAYPTDL